MQDEERGVQDGYHIEGDATRSDATSPVRGLREPTEAAARADGDGHAHSDDGGPSAALQAAFPSMDKAIIEEVLAAHGGNADAASMALLELSDDTEGAKTATNPEDAASLAKSAQLASDEAYARELMAQMEREHQQAYGRPLGTAPPRPSRVEQQAAAGQEIDYSALNYVPRQRRRQSGQDARDPAGPGSAASGAPSGGGYRGQGTPNQAGEGGFIANHRDEIDQLAEQFGKLTDTGKKTFNTFLSKAKDKYAQVQQQRAQNMANAGAEGYAGGQHGSGSGMSAPTTIAGFTIPAIPAPWQNFKRPLDQREQAKTESPGMRESTIQDYSRSPDQSTIQTYQSSNVADSNKPLPSLATQPPRVASSPDSGVSRSTPAQLQQGHGDAQVSKSPTYAQAQAQPLSTGTRSEGTSASTGQPGPAASSTSPAKIQMLPRQTISLLDNTTRSGSPGARLDASKSSTPAAAQHRDDDEDDDDVEYVRNPFNDDD